MNAETNPKLKLTKLEKKYWMLLVEKSTSEWSDVDSLMASQMCRDLAFIEELARGQADDDLISGTCRRVFEGSQFLKLDCISTSRNPNTQRKVVETIFKGV